MNRDAASQRSDKLLFFRTYMTAPKQIGSIIPSSRALAAKLTSPIDWKSISSAAELGAGTGAVTRLIYEQVQPKTKVLLFEKEPVLQERLKAAYPDFECYDDVLQLQHIASSEAPDGLDCIISGLPFANFPHQKREEVVRQIAASLKPGGLFVAFQYSLQMKKMLEEAFDTCRISFVLCNIPPAFVYICRKGDGASR